MPELPEVETVMRGIEPVLRGARIGVAETHAPALRRPLSPAFAQILTGSVVTDLRRRAKYILVDTDRGNSLLIHLGMSGKITIRKGLEAPDRIKHDHVRWRFDLPDGGSNWVTFNDARRFGVCDLLETKDLADHPMIKGLGPEPLDHAFTADVLSDRLKGKNTPIKAALLDQSIVAGLGNIYVAEALFRAKISPRRLARTVVGARAARLVPAIKEVLAAAIKSGGSTLRDYVRSDGGLGYFQHQFDVYDQADKPCKRESCDGVVKRIVQSNRSTYYCPVCQR